MIQRRIFRGAVFGGFVALVAGGASCTSLPDIQAGTCGNGVVEPDHNEDCDNTVTGDAGKAVCYPAGSASPCHFDCSSSACPTGFSCGIDAVCRKAKGTFAEVGHPTQVSADRLFAADFDQDGLGDVVAETDVQMEVLYGDRSAGLNAPFVIRAEGNPDVSSRQLTLNPTIGALALDPNAADSESNADIIFTKSIGVTTWRGRSDRTLLPTGYPSFHIGTDHPQFTTMQVTGFGSQVLMLLPGSILPSSGPTFDGSLFVRIIGGDLDLLSFFAAVPGKKPVDLAGVPLVGAFDKTSASPCDEYALAFKNATSVDVYRSCAPSGAENTLSVLQVNNPAPPGYILPTTIALPPGFTVRGDDDAIGVHSCDFDGNGTLDLFVDAVGPLDAGGTGLVTLLSFGAGDGTFGPMIKALDGGPVLAAGQLTTVTDKIVDVITPQGFALQVPDPGSAADSGASTALDFASDIPWTEATIADIDGDGMTDIVAAAQNRIDIYKGTGTQLFTHVPYVVDGNAGGIQVGDFDGDLVPDVVFRASHNDNTSDLNVMWGKLFSVPENPQFLGRFGTIIATTQGVVLSSVGNNDAIADLGVLTQTPNALDPVNGPPSFDVSVLAGSPTRQLQSLYFVQEPVGQNLQRLPAFPLAYAVGQLTRGDQHPDLAMATAIARDPSQVTTDLVDMKIAVAQGSGAALLANPPLFAPDPFDTFNSFVPGVGKDGKTKLDVSVADWTHLSLATVDFDAPGPNAVDEIVGIAPASLTAGSFFWAKLDGDSWKVEEKTPRGALVSSGQNRLPIAQVATADLNGDGAADVLLLSDTGTSSSLTAYINGQDGKFPTKSAPISLPAYASGATETPFHIVSVAPIDADADPGKEVALLTDAGGLFLAKSNAAGDTFTVSGPICSDGSVNGCVNVARTRIASGNALAAIDVDGDGIQDLLVESGQTLHVYKGLAVDP